MSGYIHQYNFHIGEYVSSSRFAKYIQSLQWNIDRAQTRYLILFKNPKRFLYTKKFSFSFTFHISCRVFISYTQPFPFMKVAIISFSCYAYWTATFSFPSFSYWQGSLRIKFLIHEVVDLCYFIYKCNLNSICNSVL